jgi:hypothetical protein
MSVRTYNAKDAVQYIKETNAVLVGRGDFIRRAGGYNGHILMFGQVSAFEHPVTTQSIRNYWDNPPQGYMIEITRPRWMYGNEGFLFESGLTYMGVLDDDDFEDITEEEFENLPEEGHFWAYKDQWEWERFNPYMEGMFD